MEQRAADAGSAAIAGGEGEALVVAISSRALFDLGESHELFERVVVVFALAPFRGAGPIAHITPGAQVQ